MSKKPQPPDDTSDADDTEPELDQEDRIRQLEEQVRELGGFSGFEGNDLDPDMKESFLRRVITLEEGGWNRPADLLSEKGFVATAPDQVSDEDMPQKLRDLVHAMALHNMFLENTDHLSDRELYTELVNEHLAEETMLGPREPVRGYHFTIDMVGSGSDEDAAILFRYYLEGDMRESWLRDSPEQEWPAKEDPPFDRDRFLPKPDLTPVDWDEDEPFM